MAAAKEADTCVKKSKEMLEANDIKQEFGAGICWACLGEENLKDMNITHYNNQKPEVYSELISYCFSIQVGEETEGTDKMNFICDNCIGRLRDAANFRTLIEVTRVTIKSLLCKPVEISDFLEQSVDEEWLDEDKPELDSSKVILRRDGRPARKRKSLKVNSKESIRKAIKKEEGTKTVEGRTHRRKEELPYKLEKTDLKCKICGEVFPVHKGLQMHMPVHFPNHICEQCGRWFATRTQLQCHTASHTTAVEACPICPNRVFKATGSLKAHMRRHQGHIDVYKCTVCTDRFPSYNARRRHLVAFHGEEDKKYACKHCPKRFCLQSHLSVHVRSIHLQERGHGCPQCSSTFFSSQGLRFHMLKHSGERLLECSVCKKRYDRAHTLKRHMKIHTGERAHVCYVCGKAFTQRCTLKAHMALHDKEISPETQTESKILI